MPTINPPSDRYGSHELEEQIALVANNPVADGLLKTVHGMLAVLNEKHQVISINETFLSELGIKDPAKILGLKPGETFNCVHAFEGEHGCGSSPFCPSCGAAIAMVTSMAEDGPAERICALTRTRNGVREDLALKVRSHPILLDGRRFILLFLQDITREQERAVLERSFYHDINNTLMTLTGACELLDHGPPDDELVQLILRSSFRMTQEVEIQRHLSQTNGHRLEVRLEETDPGQILDELKDLTALHPASERREVRFARETPSVTFKTDPLLCLRVLANMVINAFEASEKGDLIKVWAEDKAGMIEFFVWNEQAISRVNALRVFQRNFSTKAEAGRGIGTYSMKLFGEIYLGGQVDFKSSEKDGTVFRLALPVDLSGPSTMN